MEDSCLRDSLRASLGASEATISLSLRLVGGKGGFGSNLRAAGKKTQIDNFDSCRDLQGRRIRHNTAAQKLEEWQAEAEERELEKVALRHLKQVEKEERRARHGEADVDVKIVRVASKQTLAGVRSAVKYGLKQSLGFRAILRETPQNRWNNPYDCVGETSKRENSFFGACFSSCRRCL